MQIQMRNRLAELGNVNNLNKSAVMLGVIEEFCNGLKSSIVGKNRYIEKKVLVGSAQINVALDEDLARSLKNIIPEKDLDDEEILTAISNSRGIESSVLITEVSFAVAFNDNSDLELRLEFRLPIKIWSAIKSIAWNNQH